VRARTLFATHYHELTELELTRAGVKNYNVAVREWNDQVIFLRKIVRGGADKSYGIQVARLAGLPASVITRARDILIALEHDELSRGGRPALSGAPAARQEQLRLFQAPVAADDAVRDRIRELDLNRTTPLEALQILSELKREME